MQNHSRTNNKHREHPGHDRERGQMLLVLAFAMVGLLVAAGIAVDVGVLFMRQAQLDRAVDAAALAGVIALSEDDLDAAHTRGQQLLAANNVMTTSAVNCDAVNWQPVGPNDYCGSEAPGLIPGSTRYHVEALWWSETYFMPLIGFDKILITSTATAEYLPMVDVFASDTSHFGLVKTASPSTYGPNICTNRGDAYIPYRGDGFTGTALTNPWWDETYGVYTYRISIPEDYPYDKVRVELFDPDGGNYYGDNGTPQDNAVYYERNGVTHTHNNINRWLAVVDATNEVGVEGGNEYWFLNVDEYTGDGAFSDGTSCSGDHRSRMRTQSNILFRLFYYRQTAGGVLEPVDLAYYIGKAWISTSDLAGQSSNHPTSFTPPYGGGPRYTTTQWTPAQAYAEAQLTDLMWVSPGAPASVRMPEYDEILSTPAPGSPIGGGKPSGLWSPEEPATIVEPCETIRAAYYRSPESGGIDAYAGWLTNATECSATTDGNFVVDLTSEVPGIYEPPGGGGLQLYLQVTSLRGSGENVYDLWAGPTRDEDPDVAAPAYVNARHVYILNEKAEGNEYHHSRGVAIYALGRMPMNMVTGSRTDIPLTYLGSEYSGLEMQIGLFDSDSGTSAPLVFYFDTVPEGDWAACFGGAGDCAPWPNPTSNPMGPYSSTPSNWQFYNFTLPSEGDGVPFYGGRMIANYDGGSQDTFTWRVTLKARPFLVQ